ncbi:hypothetical protein N9544_01030 [Flavobacteriales bacterium]|nr:hypothetical protein [Flavobacteriales bacterium]
MKNKYSLIVCLLVSIVLIQFRINYTPNQNSQELKLTNWDSFGYYSYLPSILIYEDCKQLNWVPTIDSIYDLTGGKMYQANKVENGNYVFKYLGGVALLETPLFLMGHLIAKNSSYPADGFSTPYQYSLGYGVILYFILSLFLFRSILNRYFNDFSVSLSLLILVLATNLIQYVGIDSAQSHAYIFPLYVLILYFTIKWHEKPSAIFASAIGLTIGIATICRPTEAIMLFIPLLWSLQTKDSSKAKWNLVKQNRKHLLFVFLFGIIGVLPQLIYWKLITGSFIYDVGSKWVFANPFFRVLFGWETGWFIYTPATIFFVLGLFFIKKFPFRKSVLVFCLLNVWIVISWFDWKYGSTYSTRAMVQSYPIFALSLAAFIQYFSNKKWKFLMFIPALYFIGVNLFQIHQYNTTVLHSRDMNRLYYASIYLNPSPTPLDMSLLDADEFLRNESNYKLEQLFESNNDKDLAVVNNNSDNILNLTIPQNITWIKVSCDILSEIGYGNSYISYSLNGEKNDIRLFNAISSENETNSYEFFIKSKNDLDVSQLELSIVSLAEFKGTLKELKVIGYSNK